MITVSPHNVRYESARIVSALVNARRALHQLQDELIGINVMFQEMAKPLTSEMVAVRQECNRLQAVVYADEITASGSNMAAWDFESIMLRMGEAACAVMKEK